LSVSLEQKVETHYPNITTLQQGQCKNQLHVAPMKNKTYLISLADFALKQTETLTLTNPNF